jgi:hypothetical protein
MAFNTRDELPAIEAFLFCCIRIFDTLGIGNTKTRLPVAPLGLSNIAR